MWYNILLVDKSARPDEPNWWVRYNMCQNENLELIAKFYSQLYDRFKTYLSETDNYEMYDLILTEDPNHDPDCGAFKFERLNLFPDLINKEFDFLLSKFDEYTKPGRNKKLFFRVYKRKNFYYIYLCKNKKHKKLFIYNIKD